MGEVARVARSRVLRWAFDPAQETKLRAGDRAIAAPGESTSEFGEIVAIDLEAGTVGVKVGPKSDTRDLETIISLLPGTPFPTTGQKKALLEMGRWVVEHKIDADGSHRAVRAGLREDVPGGADRRRHRPGGGADRNAGGAAGASAGRGPGERRTVGIAAVSHSAIGNLLGAVVEHAREEGVRLRILQKAREDQSCGIPSVGRTDLNPEVEARVAAGTVDIVAGTTWLWSRPALAASIDTLVVDEAGQVSLANLATTGRAARNSVLLGDPQQMTQPVKGARPPARR